MFSLDLALTLLAAAVAALDPMLYAAAAGFYGFKARQENAARHPAGCYAGLAIVHVTLAISKLSH